MSDPQTNPPAPIIDVVSSQPDETVLTQAVQLLQQGGVIAFPTDTLYGIGCALMKNRAAQRIHEMRGIDGRRRPLTFLLPDLGEVARWAVVSGNGYRIMNRIFPGPYCVELTATDRVPRTYLNEQRRTIGVRVPDSPLCEKLLWLLGTPILTATAKSRDGRVLTTAAEIQQEYGSHLDLILNAGPLSGPASTVASLVDDWVQVLREGRGPATRILAD